MNKIVRSVAAAALLAGCALVTDDVALASESPTTASGDGVLTGNAVNLDVDAPITVCGIVVAPLGAAPGGCTTLGDPIPDTTHAAASGDGLVAGNAVTLDVDLPVTVANPVALPGARSSSPCCAPTPAPPCCPPPAAPPCCAPPTTTPCCAPPTTKPCCVPPTTTPCCVPSTTTSTTTPPTTTPPTTAPPTTASSTTAPPPAPPSPPPTEAGAARPSELPVTGSGTGLLASLGVAALGAGVLARAASRRVRRGNHDAAH